MRLPLSNRVIGFRDPDGADEAMIADLPVDRPVASGIALLDRLAVSEDGAAIDAETLLLTDFETALVGLRRHVSGDVAVSEPHCAQCGARIEISFSLAALAEAALPRAIAGVEPMPGGGAIDGAAFRLPTAGDAAMAEIQADAPARLFAACVADDLAPLARRRIERAMARLAPLLSRVIAAQCVACSAVLRAVIHVPSFVIGELSVAAASVFDDVHLLARGYGWHEAEILALPRARRRRYAARLRAGS